MGLYSVNGLGARKDYTAAAQLSRGRQPMEVTLMGNSTLPSVTPMAWESAMTPRRSFGIARRRNKAMPSPSLFLPGVTTQFGVPQDDIEAYKWVRLAAAQGDDDAVKLGERHLSWANVARANCGGKATGLCVMGKRENVVHAPMNP